MSKATTAESRDLKKDGRGVEWLERNADEFDPSEHTETESADRAREGLEEAKVEPQDNTGEKFSVALPDGDEHLTDALLLFEVEVIGNVVDDHGRDGEG